MVNWPRPAARGVSLERFLSAIGSKMVSAAIGSERSKTREAGFTALRRRLMVNGPRPGSRVTRGHESLGSTHNSLPLSLIHI